ncbi:hypothetical protein C8F01DRAFT_1374811 [Mycena amicta]|nr:hypothetical protein C8F01DRAFT_1374811 [Mycena amicta]
MSPIILYDVACDFPAQTMSPNVAKIRCVDAFFSRATNLLHHFRYALNYKGLSFKTIWVDLSELQSLYKKLGAKSTAEAGVRYTVPVIHDTNNGIAISNSLDIALYLDAAYPQTPRLIPHGTGPLHAVLTNAHGTAVATPLAAFTFPASYPHLNPPSQQYFDSQGRGPVVPSDADAAKWQQLKDGLDLFDKYIRVNGDQSKYFTGDALTYADFILAGSLRWANIALTKEQWEEISSWNGGRWRTMGETRCGIGEKISNETQL